jgi:hypothetical protein
MSPSTRSCNLAARMGRSATHWTTAVFGWLEFVVAVLAIGTTAGTKNSGRPDYPQVLAMADLNGVRPPHSKRLQPAGKASPLRLPSPRPWDCR